MPDSAKCPNAKWARVSLVPRGVDGCRLCYSTKSVPAKPLDITLEIPPLARTLQIAPKPRLYVVDLRSHFAAELEALSAYRNCLYWSFHTTAGFLDRSLAARLREEHIPTYVDAVRTFFPEGAGYEHDRL